MTHRFRDTRSFRLHVILAISVSSAGPLAASRLFSGLQWSPSQLVSPTSSAAGFVVSLALLCYSIKLQWRAASLVRHSRSGRITRSGLAWLVAGTASAMIVWFVSPLILAVSSRVSVRCLGLSLQFIAGSQLIVLAVVTTGLCASVKYWWPLFGSMHGDTSSGRIFAVAGMAVAMALGGFVSVINLLKGAGVLSPAYIDSAWLGLWIFSHGECVLVAAGIALVAIISAHVADCHRKKSGLCWMCGYDLLGVDEAVCPECGHRQPSHG